MKLILNNDKANIIEVNQVTYSYLRENKIYQTISLSLSDETSIPLLLSFVENGNQITDLYLENDGKPIYNHLKDKFIINQINDNIIDGYRTISVEFEKL